MTRYHLGVDPARGGRDETVVVIVYAGHGAARRRRRDERAAAFLGKDAGRVVDATFTPPERMAP